MGVLEETPSPFLCRLAVPVPSSLASPVACPLEPELSTAPQLSHREEESGWAAIPASDIAGSKSTPAGLREGEEGPSPLAML